MLMSLVSLAAVTGPRRRAILGVTLMVAMATAGHAQQTPPAPSAGALRAAVERGLTSAALGFEALQSLWTSSCRGPHRRPFIRSW